MNERQHLASDTIIFDVTSGGELLPDALVFLVCRRSDTGAIIVRESRADKKGRTCISYSPGREELFYASAMAEEGTWYGATKCFDRPVTLECPPLDHSGPIDWWHRKVGIETYDPNRGAGIRIGLLDTGIGPHPYLDHVEDLGAIIEGQYEADGSDVSYHGSMMAGLINAMPVDPAHPAGIVPGAQLFSLRICKNGLTSAGAHDVAAGIVVLATKMDVDLINMSFHRETASETQRRAIEAAREHGVLCIASAGNQSASPVRFPGALPGVVSVGGVGWSHPGLTLKSNEAFRPVDGSRNGTCGAFLSEQSCWGEGLTCVAPSLALVSTVASEGGRPTYASITGSSAATALVTGVLAAKLAEDAVYLAMPRNADRAEYARAVLEDMCQTLGLARDHEGRGMPVLSR